ncbi:MAG: hypothetical protein RMM51_06410 [Verrucomicrobiae bacterium]|nr:hypothetical protein [Verrucomicrobiae bacterium]
MSLRAGAAVRDISPTRPIQLSGYPHAIRISTGIHDPLLAAALYLENNGCAVLLGALDLLMLNRDVARHLRWRVAQRLGIPETHVFISCTHTHSAPVTADYRLFAGDPALSSPDSAYLKFCEDQMVAAAVAARQSVRPAELGWTTANAQGVGGNRHSPDGPTDPEVGVLAVRSDGEWLAVGMIYSMHPTVLHEDSTLVSADFPAFARQCVPASVVLYHTGPCGNQSPRYYVRGQTFTEAARLGRKLGEAVAARLSSIRYDANPLLAGDIRAVNLPPRVLPTLAEAERTLTERRAEFERLKATRAERALVRTAEVAVFGAEAMLRLVQSDIAAIRASVLPAEVQVLRIGDACVVGWPGEVFVEYALELKRRAPRRTFVVAFVNGELQGYIVTPDATGYEASSSLFQPKAGTVLVETALEMLQ